MTRSASSFKLGQSMVTDILDKLAETEHAHEQRCINELIERNHAAGGNRQGFFWQGKFYGHPSPTTFEKNFLVVADIGDEIAELEEDRRQRGVDFQLIKQGVAVLFRYAGTPEKAVPYMPAFMVAEFFPALRSLHPSTEPLTLPSDGIINRQQSFQKALDLIYKYLANRILY